MDRGHTDNSVPFRCYKRITGAWTWSQGAAVCDSAASGATLAEFQSQSEFAVAYNLCTPRTSNIPDWCWTGIYADPVPGTNRTCCWKFGNGGDPTWLRNNGAKLWASTEPNNASGAQYCVDIGYLTGMDDTECSNGMGVMCSLLAVADSPSPTPSLSPSPSLSQSPSTSPPASPSPSPSTSQSPSISATSSVTPSPSASASSSLSASPTSTPSPSKVPVLTVVQNVTAVIDNELPSISISAPTTTTAGAESTVGVTSSFQNLQVGSNTPATLQASDVTVTVEDRPASTDPESTATVPTHIYRSVLPDTTTTFEQSFAFHNQSAQGQFAQMGFTIGSSTLKWSINVTGASAEQLTVRYRLATLGSVADATDSSQPVIVRPSLPRANMTTYFFTLLTTSSSPSSTSASSRITAKVEVFDVALVDGIAVPLVGHSVVLANSSAAQPEYLLELTFPAFAHSLFYDPSISMGLLLNNRDKSSSSSDGSLVIAVAVVVPVALLVVALAAAVATLWTKVHRTRVRERVRQQTLAFNMTTLE